MSALLLPALAAGSSGQGALYVDDVFSTYLYTGNGSTQTINNGIDLAGKGGLVWIRSRNAANDHKLVDTARGVGKGLVTNSTAAQSNDLAGITAFQNNGFSLSYDYSYNASYINGGGGVGNPYQNYVSWTFRKAPKFFDVVTYTGTGSAQSVAHSLGQTPGMIIVKSTGMSANWQVWHRSLTNAFSAPYTNVLELNTTGAQAGNDCFDGPGISATHFKLSTSGNTNANGATYVAYIFAHDQSAEGIIQCGSFTTDGNGNATVNLGWANGSQFAMIKAASTTGDWEMYDTARTSAWSGNDARLRTNLSSAEDFVARISASGTSITFAGLTANSTYIYMAIRSPS